MEIKMQEKSTRDFGDDDKKEWPVIPENTVVECEVTRCEIRELNPEFRAKYNIQDEVEVNFAFKVDDPDYPEFQNQWLWGTAKPYLDNSDGCRLRLWLQAIYGIDRLPEDYSLKVNDANHIPDLLGLRCRVLVRNKAKSDGTLAHSVKDVLRLPATRKVQYEDSF